MDRFAVGFLFNKHGEVALIRKNRPAWQNGRLNGIGGHVEEGESAAEAMVREFREEAGARIRWQHVGIIGNDNFQLSFFTSDEVTQIATMTDEEVIWCRTHPLPDDVIDNLHWMVPMAKYALTHDMWAEIEHMDDTC